MAAILALSAEPRLCGGFCIGALSKECLQWTVCAAIVSAKCWNPPCSVREQAGLDLDSMVTKQ